MDFRLNSTLKASGAQLAAALIVGACTALMIARTIELRTAQAPPEEQEADARELAKRSNTGDMVFGPDFIPLEMGGRTDVPWQAPESVDPDHVRSF